MSGMTSPLGAGAVLPCGTILPVAASTGLPGRPGPVGAGLSGLPGPVIAAQLVPGGLGVDPLAVQLARLSRYQAAAAAAACLMAGNASVHQQSSAGHLLTYLYARQQQQHRIQQQERIHAAAGDACGIYQIHQPAHHQHQTEEPKPSHSYIGIIAMAILGSTDRKLVLSDIYQWILDNYPYFRRRGPGWRNSIRHNLSLNDCFVKAGRSANGKGHYWAIHPANVDDFERGDFRRRRAQRKVRRAMGLAVADEEDDSPIPSPSAHGSAAALQSHPAWPTTVPQLGLSAARISHPSPPRNDSFNVETTAGSAPVMSLRHNSATSGRKRLFDVESLLAPDADKMAAVKPEVDSTTEPATVRSRLDEPTLLSPLYRKGLVVSPPDVIAICDSDVTTTSGSADRSLTDDDVDIMTPKNSLSLIDWKETGSGFPPLRHDVDAKTTSGKPADADARNMWLPLRSKSFYSVPTSRCHVTRVSDIIRMRDLGQGYGEGHGLDDLVKSRETSSPARENMTPVN